jgi:DNA-binding LacI/PurR family transcriptional regulator
MVGVSQKDIAKILGVNQTTVSRALKGSPRVSKAMKDKVLNLCDSLGYQPDCLASSLSSGETRIISALKLSRQLNDIHSRWIDCLQDSAHEYGYSFRLDRMDDIKRLAGERSSDGFIVFGRWDRIEPQTMSYVYNTKRPVVFTDCESADLPPEAVAIDNSGGMAEAVRYLYGLGHKKIGFFGLVQRHPVCRERHHGYLREMNELGITAPGSATIAIDDWPFEPDDVYVYGDSLMATVGSGITAFVASSDVGAVGIFKMLKRFGLKVPEDISVIGFDDSLLARAFEPPLTTVRQDIVSAARAAVGKLVGYIRKEEATPGIIIPTQLMVRATTTQCRQYASVRTGAEVVEIGL